MLGKMYLLSNMAIFGYLSSLDSYKMLAKSKKIIKKQIQG